MTDLWFKGKATEGKSGISPEARFLKDPSSTALHFWLVKDDTRIRFGCWCMNSLARMTHVNLFVSLYGIGSVSKADAIDSEGAEGELKVVINGDLKREPKTRNERSNSARISRAVKGEQKEKKENAERYVQSI